MSGWLRGRCRRVLTTAGPQLAPGLERRRRQLVLVLVLDSGVGRTLPLLLILQGPVVATLGAFYDPDHALVQGRGLFKGAARVATFYGARTTITRVSTTSTRSCRATRSCSAWSWQFWICFAPASTRTTRSWSKRAWARRTAPRSRSGSQRHSASLVCLCATGTAALAQEPLVAAADASRRGLPVTTVSAINYSRAGQLRRF